MSTLFDLRKYAQACHEILTLLSRHRRLTVEMARRELADRYLGQVFGWLWVIGHPVLQMAVYVFVFAYVFDIRVGGARPLPLSYTVYLLSGLIPWLGFQDAMSRSCVAVTSHTNLVKQVVFPVEVLPVKSVLASLATMLICLTLLVAYVLLFHQSLLWTYLLVPVLLVLQVLAMVGVSYCLASVGVYFKDVKDFVQVFAVLGIYLLPVFYLPEQVPSLFRPFLYLNPFSYLAWCYQDALFFGEFVHWWAWLVLPCLSLGVFGAGYRLFRKLKIMFGSAL